MKRALVVVVLVVAAAALVVPWLVGIQVADRYQDALGQLPAQGLRVADERYQRGWFSSSAVAEFVAQPAPGQPQPREAVRFRVASRLYHGPWHLSVPRPGPAAALVESRVELRLPRFDPPPLLLTTVLDIDGAGVVQLRLPPIERTAGIGGPALSTAEGRGEFRFEAGGASAKGWFELSSCEIAGDGDTRVRLEGLRSQGTGSRWHGGLIVGEGDLKIDALTFHTPNGELHAEGGSAVARSLPNGEFFDLQVEYGLNRLHWSGSEYRGAEVALSLRGIPAEELAALRRALKEASPDPGTPVGARPVLGTALAAHLPSLLAHNPRLALDRLTLHAPEGEVAGNLWLGVQGLTREAMVRPGACIEHLEGGGELSVPSALLVELLGEWRRGRMLEALRQRDPELTAIPPGLEYDIATAARDQLAALIRDGWAAEQDGRVSTAFKLGDALLTVNGKTFPIGGIGLP